MEALGAPVATPVHVRVRGLAEDGCTLLQIAALLALKPDTVRAIALAYHVPLPGDAARLATN